MTWIIVFLRQDGSCTGVELRAKDRRAAVERARVLLQFGATTVLYVHGPFPYGEKTTRSR